jgi:RNA 2',3'-cyclic 3'-phosphodiesterase
MPDDVRAFVALELEADLHERLARLVDDLRSRLPAVRFSAVANAHLTLRFLGPSSPDALQQVADALRPAAEACHAADVGVTGLGMFPPHGAPKVLWLGLDLPASMHALQATCERAARSAGFEAETRAFRPHLTLGRWRERAARPPLPEVPPSVVRIERMILFRSELKPSGAVHTPLEVFPLGAARGTAILPPSS